MPASGLALYLDRLVRLVKLEEPGITSPKMVTVRADTDSIETMKEVFRIAQVIRDSGYAAVISIDNNITTGAGWLVDIKDGSGQLTLTDLTKSNKYEVSGVREALNLMEGKGGSKAGPA